MKYKKQNKNKINKKKVEDALSVNYRVIHGPNL